MSSLFRGAREGVRRPGTPGKAVTVSLFTIASVALFLAFSSNWWGTADQSSFESSGGIWEPVVVNSIMHHRATGQYSSPLGLGLYVGADHKYLWKLFRGEQLAFTAANETGSYTAYLSQIGGQAYLFTAADSLFHPDSIRGFHVLNSLLLASLLGFMVVWAAIELNLGAALLLLIGTLFSKWLVFYGRDLYMMAWTWYLPMIAVGCILYRADSRGKARYWVVYATVYTLILLKCVLSGYEYVSTVLLAAATPAVYYSLKEKVQFATVTMRVLAIGVCGVGAFATSILIHAALLGPTFQEGLNTISQTASRRTYGSPDQFPPEFAESLQASPITVVKSYFVTDGPFGGDSSLKPPLIGDLIREKPLWRRALTIALYLPSPVFLSYLWLTIAFALINVSYWRNPAWRTRPLDALSITLAFSITAPLSWFILAKSHSYFHIFLNIVLWQLPYTLVGFMFVGAVIWRPLAAVLGRRNWIRTSEPLVRDRVYAK